MSHDPDDWDSGLADAIFDVIASMCCQSMAVIAMIAFCLLLWHFFGA